MIKFQVPKYSFFDFIHLKKYFFIIRLGVNKNVVFDKNTHSGK